jgi:hypothetical protein
MATQCQELGVATLAVVIMVVATLAAVTTEAAIMEETTVAATLVAVIPEVVKANAKLQHGLPAMYMSAVRLFRTQAMFGNLVGITAVKPQAQLVNGVYGHK